MTVQLRVPIRTKDAPRYEIFRGQSLSVPVVTDSSFADPQSNHDYTKVSMTHDYLAVSNRGNFIELDATDLDQCDLIRDVY